MKRPILDSKWYYVLGFGSYLIPFVGYVAAAYFKVRYAWIGLVLMGIYTFIWMRFLDWMQGHRKTIFSKYEFGKGFYGPYARRQPRKEL